MGGSKKVELDRAGERELEVARQEGGKSVLEEGRKRALGKGDAARASKGKQY